MPLQNKRSYTPGNRTNLASGEIAVQIADEKLLMRQAGRRVEVDLDGWLRGAPPVSGVVGAPLQRLVNGVGWATSLVPIGYVDGAVRVDLPPAGYGVPGLEIAAVGAVIALVAEEATAGSFYVASETLRLTRLAWNCTDTGDDLPLRVGVLDAGGDVVFETEVTPETGSNTLDVDVDLPRGLYYAVLWTSGPISVRSAAGFRAEQGWNYATNGTPVFVNRRRDILDMSEGLTLPAGIVTLSSPGENHVVLMDWAV